MVLVRKPHRTKLNRELANILCGNTYEEKLQNANSLQIEATEHVGKFNPSKGRPIAIKFTSKNDAEMILKTKRSYQRGFLWTDITVLKQKKNVNGLDPSCAACRLEEYQGKCQMEGRELIICGKCYSFENLSDLPQNLSPEVLPRCDSLWILWGIQPHIKFPPGCFHI